MDAVGIADGVEEVGCCKLLGTVLSDLGTLLSS